MTDHADSTEELWPGDLRPIDPTYGVPVNPDGTKDLSRGIPRTPGVHDAIEALRAKLAVMNAEERHAGVVHAMEEALHVLSWALPLATPFIPAAAAPYVVPTRDAVSAFVDALKQEKR